MKYRGLILGLIMAVLVIAGTTAPWWLAPLLAFVGTNSDLIQGTTDTVQLGLWIIAGLFGLGSLWRSRDQLQPGQKPELAEPSLPVTKAEVKVQGQGGAASNGGTAAGQGGIAIGRDVGGDVNHIVVQVTPAILEAITPKNRHSEDITQATQDYLTHLIDRYRYLDFKGMGVSDRIPLRLPLVEMYVPLKARIELPEGETWARHLRLAGREISEEEVEATGQRLSEPQPVLNLLQNQAGLIILGDPGAGKTTFLKYLALRLALGQAEALGLETRLPVLLPLSAYANALAEDDLPLDRFIVDYYQKQGLPYPLQALLAEALKGGKTLFLLDGLDEVKALDRRHLVVERVVSFFTSHYRQGNKFLLTSRVVGYREVRPTVEGLAECTLVDFGREDIEDFVTKWTAALEKAARGQTQVAQLEAAQERTDLLSAVELNPGVRQLAANPLLLTILALMKRQGVTLPERRVELYQKYLETLLRTWNLARGLEGRARYDLDVVETTRILAPLALWMHQTSPGVGLVKQQDVQRQLEAIYGERDHPDPEAAAWRLLQDARDHASLLLERGAGSYGFIHLTFQEYLAAVAVAQQGQRGMEPVVQTLAEHVGDDNWHEVSILTVGYIGIIQGREEAAGVVVRDLLKTSPEATILAGEAVVDAWPGGVDRGTRQYMIQVLQKMMIGDQQFEPRLRVRAGQTLARLGDERPGVGCAPDTGWPDITWCQVPAGPFVMGSDPARDSQARDSEFPQHEVDLPEYQISRYPITNAQYTTFVEDGGYTERWRQCWTEAGWDWKGGRTGPETWGGVFDLPTHPVVMVRWYEALAYCRWLTVKFQEIGLISSEQMITLPTEAQWEKAARGTDGRLYPWGDEIRPNQANYDDTGVGSTSPVGCFPGGRSPYGCEEMAGNVWEWCLTKWREDYQTDSDEDPEGTDHRVLRGGAFPDSGLFVRCAARHFNLPNLRDYYLGFRVAVSPFS